MDKKISVPLELPETKEQVVVPISYRVEVENENVTKYHCEVDWKPEDRPQWLDPHQFVIRQVYSPGNSGVGVTVTELANIPVRSIETALLVNKTHDHIRVKERLAAIHG